MKAKLLILFALSFALITFSQEEMSKQRQLYIDAQKQIQLKNYKDAIPILEKIHETNPANSNINYLLGYCYYSLGDKENKIASIKYFEKAVKNVSTEYKSATYKEQNAPVVALFYLGYCYYLDYNFSSAIENLEKYKTYLSEPEEINKINVLIDWAKNGEEFIKNPLTIDIINLGDTINSEYDDHSPVISLDEKILIFTSKRKGSTGNLKTTDGQYFEDIYISRKTEDGKWGMPEKISYNINTMEHEASIALSADGKELFIYKDDVGEGGNIYRSVFVDGDWTKPEKLGSNINTEYNESHATISPDGRVLYFTSDRPGGFGGFDIYYVNRLPNGEWGLAQNIGNVINTELDEAGPYIYSDGATLYFSSKGHNSMGGFDLFFSVMKDDGTITKPQNLGYPINTVDDDVFYVLSADGKRAYYSSVRKDTRGLKDIYLMDLVSIPERSLVVVSGYLKDKKGNIVKDAVLSVYDIKTNDLVGEFKPNRTTGKYLLVLPKSKVEYRIESDYGEFENDKIIIPEESSFYYLRKPVILETIGTFK